MKTEVRKELQKTYRKHWINAFMKLKYDKSLTDKENIGLFFDWAYSVYWDEIKELLKHEQLNEEAFRIERELMILRSNK